MPLLLERLSLWNFKCFEALELPCSALTVLTGYNSAGKSTALQALLLLAQGLQSAHEKWLPLNGGLVRLGDADDVLRHGAGEPSFSLGVRGGDECIKWTFGCQSTQTRNRAVQLTALEYRRGEKESASNVQKPNGMLLSMEHAHSPLASAVRGVVRVGVSREDGFAGVLGGDVPAAPLWYMECADRKVDIERCHPESDSRTVRAQVDAWLNELFPGAKAKVKRVAPDAPVQVSFSLGKSNPWARSESAGSGLHYAFPMLVALLTGKRGSIIVVDSAEGHLHPRVQSAIGQLLGQMAGAGLQIFVETHSDHLFNGARLAVCDGLVKPDEVVPLFFGQDGVLGRVTTLEVDRYGTVSDCPEGFFDQAENDLALLSGWKT